MCYGNASISSTQENVSGVWASNFGGVWHLNTAASDAKNSITGGSSIISGVANDAGKVAGAGKWGTNSTDAITTDLTTQSTQRTYSLWTYRTGDGGASLGRMFDKRSPSITTFVENLQNNNNGNYDFSRGWSGAAAAWSVLRPSANAWHHIVITYDSSSTSNVPSIYIDGITQSVTTAIAPAGIPVSNSAAYTIGNRTDNNTRVWSGNLDEFRIANTIRTADWIKTEYNNQISPATFYTISAQ